GQPIAAGLQGRSGSTESWPTGRSPHRPVAGFRQDQRQERRYDRSLGVDHERRPCRQSHRRQASGEEEELIARLPFIVRGVNLRQAQGRVFESLGLMLSRSQGLEDSSLGLAILQYLAKSPLLRSPSPPSAVLAPSSIIFNSLAIAMNCQPSS